MDTYIHRNNLQQGPYTDEQLRELLANSGVSLEDLAWREGLAEWRPLKTFFSSSPTGVPPVPEPLDQKFISRLNTVYRTSKMMIILCVLGFFMPFILLIAGALGVLYYFWRKSILAEVDAKGLILPQQQRIEVDYLRANKQELLLPLYFLLGFAVLMAGVIAFLPHR